MQILDLYSIGNRIRFLRKHSGMTQAEIAEKADISDRAFAEIERGSVNMRVETLLRICCALKVTPNDLLIENAVSLEVEKEEILSEINRSPEEKQKLALRIIDLVLKYDY